jgi:type 1 fimbriae regulatory protein FimB/type 1 fimbriae regulatory protein FimE
MLKTDRKQTAPASLKRTVPRRLPNKTLRTREHVTEKEVERLIKTASENRNGHRDAIMILNRLPARPACIGALRPALGSS